MGCRHAAGTADPGWRRPESVRGQMECRWGRDLRRAALAGLERAVLGGNRRGGGEGKNGVQAALNKNCTHYQSPQDRSVLDCGDRVREVTAFVSSTWMIVKPIESQPTDAHQWLVNVTLLHETIHEPKENSYEHSGSPPRRLDSRASAPLRARQQLPLSRGADPARSLKK